MGLSTEGDCKKSLNKQIKAFKKQNKKDLKQRQKKQRKENRARIQAWIDKTK